MESNYFDVKIEVPGHDLGLAPGILGGYYERFQLTIFRELARESKLIIDVGANIGLYSLLGARSSRKDARIFSFEPIPDNVDLLKRNIKLNKDIGSKITTISNALGEDSRKLEIYLSRKSVGNHSVGGKRGRGYGEVTEVMQTSLDEFTKKKKLKNIDLIKIDVEGYDGYVLKGAINTIKTSQPALMIECIPKLLKNCDFDYQEFGKILFDNYTYCYSIDEANQTVVRIKKGSMTDFLQSINDTNLVLVKKPNHKKIIDSFIKGK